MIEKKIGEDVESYMDFSIDIYGENLDKMLINMKTKMLINVVI